MLAENIYHNPKNSVKLNNKNKSTDVAIIPEIQNFITALYLFT